MAKNKSTRRVAKKSVVKKLSRVQKLEARLVKWTKRVADRKKKIALLEQKLKQAKRAERKMKLAKAA